MGEHGAASFSLLEPEPSLHQMYTFLSVHYIHNRKRCRAEATTFFLSRAWRNITKWCGSTKDWYTTISIQLQIRFDEFVKKSKEILYCTLFCPILRQQIFYAHSLAKIFKKYIQYIFVGLKYCVLYIVIVLKKRCPYNSPPYSSPPYNSSLFNSPLWQLATLTTRHSDNSPLWQLATWQLATMSLSILIIFYFNVWAVLLPGFFIQYFADFLF
jgi:hypothetical protein